MASRSFVLLLANQREGDPGAPPRLGVTVSRRVGGAVVRNRVKRRLREWFRTHQALIPLGKDLVVIARPAAAMATVCELARELATSLARLDPAR